MWREQPYRSQMESPLGECGEENGKVAAPPELPWNALRSRVLGQAQLVTQ